MTGIPPNDPTVAGIAMRARAIAARHRAIILAALAIRRGRDRGSGGVAAARVFLPARSPIHPGVRVL